jgi:hypothetical protein
MQDFHHGVFNVIFCFLIFTLESFFIKVVNKTFYTVISILRCPYFWFTWRISKSQESSILEITTSVKFIIHFCTINVFVINTKKALIFKYRFYLLSILLNCVIKLGLFRFGAFMYISYLSFNLFTIFLSLKNYSLPLNYTLIIVKL